MTRAWRAGVVLGLLSLSTVGLVAMARPVQTGRRTEGRLVFDDEFGGTRLNASHWSTCYWWGRRGCTISSNHELEWYVPNQVHVDHGIARLVAARHSVLGTDGRPYRYTSGMISSGPPPGSTTATFAFRYGRAEARMRIPAGRGVWPAFWLLPADRSDQPEIDAMEIHGQTPGIVRMHIHYGGDGGTAAVKGSDWTLPSHGTGWHRFGIDWRPGRLEWLIDGVARWKVTGSAVPRVRMYLVANLAVGGDPVGPPSRSTRFPATLEIDWIRVWQ